MAFVASPRVCFSRFPIAVGWICGATAWFAWLLWSGPTFGQQIGGGSSGANPPAVGTAILHPSEEATTLLERADEALAREDWKLVVDSLQRIIELPGDHVLATTDTKYESARLHAQRRLGAMPQAGLEVYRMIYDGQAQAIFDQAVAEHDMAALRQLADRSLVTSVGDEAAVTLADWLIDEGRFLEAAEYLRLVRSVYPDSDLPDWIVPTRLAICLAAMERQSEARSMLETVGDSAAVEPARIAEVRRYLARAADQETQRSRVGWPMAYGRSSRDGIMALVEPTFLSHLPWNVSLPVPPSRAGVGPMLDYATERKLMPTAQMATDGQVLVVRSGGSLAGLDVATFDPLWMSRPEAQGGSLLALESTVPPQVPAWSSARQSRQDIFADDPLVRQLYHDSVGSQVSMAAGLVLTIEWPGEPPNTLALRRDRGVRRRGMRLSGSGQMQPNFVVAYSPSDGGRVWTSDTTSGRNALGPVEFLAAPIAVEGSLLAPCRVNDDLYAVLLDPRTGRIDARIYLCGTGGAPFDSLYTCMPAAADGTVFIPTGRGVLAAVDAANWSIRWIVRYDHLGEPPDQMTWLPSPPMAVADVVLLAPYDADELICFDRASGEVRWHVPRGDAMYLVAATDERAYTAGERVRAVRIDDGTEVWTTDCGAPAGRAACTGDRLFVPTYDGLFVLSADDGRIIETHAAETVSPGNILAYDGSLYVASALEVRKYPDMQRGYARALQAHEQNPTEPSLAMRLAWLEYLNNEPAKALAALAKIPESLRETDQQRYDRLSHLRVLAMLELAASPETHPKKALDLLRQAQQAAPNNQDAITARLALGEYLSRIAELGGSASSDGYTGAGKLEACLEYAALALDGTGDEMINDDTGRGSYERRALLVADRKLADLLPSLTNEQIDRFAADLDERLERAIRARDLAQLRRMSNCRSLARLGMRAELALAVWAVRDLAHEQAEAYLRRVLDRGQSPELLAEAAARLAVIYLQPDELHLPVAAVELLDRLESEFPAVQLPAHILEPEWPEPSLVWHPAETLPGAEVGLALRPRVDSAILSTHRARLRPAPLEPLAGKPETTTYSKARPLVIRGPRPEALADRRLLFVDERAVEARSVEDGALLWPAELRLLGEMAVESRTVNEGFGLQMPSSHTQAAHGVACGQTLVVNTRYGLHAVGLLTGRRLWSRRFDPPAGEGQQPTGSDACVWAAGGYIASVDDYGWLEVARAERGGELLWRRRMVQRPWQTVRVVDDHLVAGDAILQRIDVFGLHDGAYLGACSFEQPSVDMVNIAAVGGVVCGPDSDREVVAYELETPGIERWRVSMPATLSQIFKPSPDLLAIADRGGRVRVIDPKDGAVKMSAEIRDCASGVIDGRIDNGVLYVFGLRMRQEQGQPAEWALAAIRMSDGKRLWSRRELGSQLPVTGDALLDSSNAIPLLVLRSPGEEVPQIAVAPRHGVAKAEMLLIDKTTGEPIGKPVSLEIESSVKNSVLLDLQVWPDRVSAFVGSTYAAFAAGGLAHTAVNGAP